MARIRKNTDIKKLKRKYKKSITNRPHRPLTKYKTINIKVTDENNQIHLMPLPVIEVTNIENSKPSKKSRKKWKKRRFTITPKIYSRHILKRRRRPGGGTGGGGTNGIDSPRYKLIDIKDITTK